MKKMFGILLFLICAGTLASSQSPISCNYELITGTYICWLHLNNPMGLDNFTAIDGQHVPGFGNNNVTHIIITSNSQTRNIPSIICEKFRNARSIELDGAGIEEIGRNALKSCHNLGRIYLERNNLSEIEADSFQSLGNLTTLSLAFNQISELPENIFSPLLSLISLHLHYNNLKIVHSKWFNQQSRHSIWQFILTSNEIDAVDEKITEIFRESGVLTMFGNICMDDLDFPPWNRTQKCFENYRNLHILVN